MTATAPEKHNPRKQVYLANSWYTDDQFAIQLGSDVSRRVIENRWRSYEAMIVEWLSSRGNKPTTLRVLDAGCGDGINLLWLATLTERLNMPVEITAVDYNPLRLSRVNFEGVTVREASLTALPFNEETYDLILCSHVLEHVPNALEALNELARVIDDQGLLLLGVPNEGCLLAQLRNHLLQPIIKRTTDHIHFYTSSHLVALLNEAKLQTTRITSAGFFYPHTFLAQQIQNFAVGRYISSILNSILPSQCAELIIAAHKICPP